MKQQLIVTLLGSDRIDILSTLAKVVSDMGCNVLDSRQAVYGQEFSLTMIVEGSQSAVTKLELVLPHTSNQLNLLCLMKRTKDHCKQNLQHLAEVKIISPAASDDILQIIHFFRENKITVSAFRQKFVSEQNVNSNMMKCKMMVNIPVDIDIMQMNMQFQAFLQQLNLLGNMVEKH